MYSQNKLINNKKYYLLKKMYNYNKINKLKILNENEKYHLILSSGSIKGCYFIGINYYIKKFMNINNIISIRGTSAGALNAVYFCSGIDTETWINLILSMPKFINKKKFSFIETITYINNIYLPENIHELCNKFRVEIIAVKITIKGLETIVFKNFKSKQDVIESINCSLCIPFITNKKKPFLYKYNNDYYIDGGIIKKNKVPIYDNINEKQIVIKYNKISYKNSNNFGKFDNNIINIMTNGFYEINNFLDEKKQKNIYLIEPKKIHNIFY